MKYSINTMMMTLLFLCLAINLSYASPQLPIPDEVFVHDNWIGLMKSYTIETSSQKLSTLNKRLLNLRLGYDLYDPQDIKIASAVAKVNSTGVYLDIYDPYNIHLGAVDEQIFAFFPSFIVLAGDSTTKLARAEINFWGTKFYIYDPDTNEEMAVMSRAFFRIKNNWTINVTNRHLLDQKNIDSRVLMTVFALQSEITDWQRNNYDDITVRTFNAKQKPYQSNEFKILSQKINALRLQQGLDKVEKPSDANLEALADELEQAFMVENPAINNHHQTTQERMDAFTSYCLTLASSKDVSETKKKAILTLLNLRIQGHE